MTSQDKAKMFLEKNRTAALATVSESNAPHVAIIFYYYNNGDLYFITDKNSQKAKDILHNRHVALAIVQENQRELLQIEGEATLIEDHEKRLQIAMDIYGRLDENDSNRTWPVIKLHPHELDAFRVTISKFKYSHFAVNSEIFEGKSFE